MQIENSFILQYLETGGHIIEIDKHFLLTTNNNSNEVIVIISPHSTDAEMMDTKVEKLTQWHEIVAVELEFKLTHSNFRNSSLIFCSSHHTPEARRQP